MRSSLMLLVTASISLPLLSQPAARIEYGKLEELRNVKSVYISTTDNEDLAKEARRQLAERLPSLAFAETEDKGDLTLAFARKAAEGADPKQLTTTVFAARSTGGTTIRVYRDASSTKPALADAVTEVIGPVVNLLQTVNPRQFGEPKGDSRPGTKVMVHTTAGLRPGLSKRDVLLALGSPTQMIGAATYTQTWIYKTSDGDIRLVFGGERLVSVSVPEKK